MRTHFLSLLILILPALAIGQTSHDRWTAGIQLGAGSNFSQLKSGDKIADSRFSHPAHGTGLLAVNFRYRATPNWHFQTGYELTGIGFTYKIAQSYSLLSPEGQYAQTNSSSSVLRVPLMVMYSFMPDCKNRYWIVGAGISGIHGSASRSSAVAGDIQTFGVASEASSRPKTSLGIDATIGRERLLKSGNKFSLTLRFHKGLSEMATSNVLYAFDGTVYNHTFSNYGDFIGLSAGWWFKQKTLHPGTKM